MEDEDSCRGHEYHWFLGRPKYTGTIQPTKQPGKPFSSTNGRIAGGNKGADCAGSTASNCSSGGTGASKGGRGIGSVTKARKA